jgi:hypothetical protein
VPIVAAQKPNSEAGPSSAPANGPPDDPDIRKDPIRDNYLHSNPYPNTAAPGQTQECEAGNETYVPGKQTIGNLPGNQGKATQKTVAADTTPKP